ncbi:unnamed protein product [Heligmosomoides polygyrus]|uniref:MAM domain-containing protein n=1 Tax=Heligmosomoides polygyrus TaxID=6339 RepID=A0A3P7TBG7_HELPZ|nr:unnamed protein product [Heligmosomoides polygyrus]
MDHRRQTYAALDVSDRSLLTEGSPVTSSACDLLSCDFTNSTCGYTNYVNDSMRLSDGAEFSACFLFVGTDSSTLGMATYILQSPEFSLTRDMTLSFDVYRRSNEITLQVMGGTACKLHARPCSEHNNSEKSESFLLETV